MSQVELLRAAVAMLDKAGIPYMVVGSYASAFHGEPRMTRDIDVVIEPTAETIKLLVDLVDRDRFYLGNAEQAVRTGSMFNLIEPGSGWKVDFVVRKDRPFSKVEFERRFLTNIAGVEVFVATAEDTMLAKLEWGAASGSDRQMDDVVAIASATEVDIDYLSRWARELGVADQLAAALLEAKVVGSLEHASVALDLGSIKDLFESAKVELESAGCTASIRRSPIDDRSKHSIGLSVIGVLNEGELWVWDSGEGELIIGSTLEDVVQTRLTDLTVLTVQDALATLTQAVV